MIYSAMFAMLVCQPPAAPVGASKPVLSLPPQIQAMPGKPFVVKAESNCKWVRWTLPSGLERVEPKDTAYGDAAFVGYGPAGVYEFKVEGTLADVFAESKCIVFVGQPQPVPPGPNPPGPGPAPNDPIFAELQRLYSVDQSPNKSACRDTLAMIYTTAAGGALRDPDIKTTAQLFAKLRSVSSVMLPAGALLAVREHLKTVCSADFGPDLPLDEGLRAKAAHCFERCAVLIQGLK